MGNSSSQPAPTQATQRAKTPARASSAPLQLSIDSTTISELEGGKARAFKRQRTGGNGERDRKPRSRPQHRRGIAIQPKLDAEPFQLLGSIDEASVVAEMQDQAITPVASAGADAVAVAQITTEGHSPGSGIIVNKDHEKTWQIEERQRQDQLTQEAVAETQALPLEVRHKEQGSVADHNASSEFKEMKRQKKKRKRRDQAEDGIIMETQAEQREATDEATDDTPALEMTAVASSGPAKSKKVKKQKKLQKPDQVEEEAVAETRPEVEAIVEIPADEADLRATGNASAETQEPKTKKQKRKKSKKRDASPMAEQNGKPEESEHLQDAQVVIEETQPQPTTSDRTAREAANMRTGNGETRLLRAVMIERSPPAAASRPDADLMPTPPESPPKQGVEAAEPASEAAAQDANRTPVQDRSNRNPGRGPPRTHPRGRTLVNRWMDNGDFGPPPAEQIISPSPVESRRRTLPAASEKPDAIVAGHETKPRKRKRSSQPPPDESDSFVEDELDRAESSQPGSEADVKPKTKRRKSSHSNTAKDDIKNFNTASRGTATGQWTAEEKAHAEHVWHDYIRVNHLDASEICSATIDWNNVGPIKMAMYEAFPNRAVTSIRKFCQRHFAPFTTGPWTAEEDERLKEAHARYLGQWSQISNVLFRSNDSVRDRWRLIVRDADTRQVGAWSVAEEENLRGVVAECVRLVRESKEMGAKLPEEVEDALNWKVVNEKMGRTRSEKRCLEKWRELKKRDVTAPASSTHAVPAAGAARVEDTPAQQRQSTQPAASPSKSGRRSRLEMEYGQLEFGDIYDALKDIVETMKADPDKQFPHESTLWSVVAGARNGVSRFAKYSGLRKRAYLGALEIWGHQKRVSNATSIPRKAAAMMKTMLKQEEKGALVLSRAWKVDASAAPRPAKQRVEQTMQGQNWLKVRLENVDVESGVGVDDTPAAARQEKPRQGVERSPKDAVVEEDAVMADTPAAALREKQTQSNQRESKAMVLGDHAELADIPAAEQRKKPEERSESIQYSPENAIPEDVAMDSDVEADEGPASRSQGLKDAEKEQQRQSTSLAHKSPQVVVGESGSPHLVSKSKQKKRKRDSGELVERTADAEPARKKTKKRGSKSGIGASGSKSVPSGRAKQVKANGSKSVPASGSKVRSEAFVVESDDEL